MSYCLSYEQADDIFLQLRKSYKIYAPKRFPKKGRYSDTDLVRYDEIKSVSEIELEHRGDYSPKEVIYPINQTLFYFTEDEYRESKVHNKEIIIFARPCDINGIKRLDKIFLENGGHEDVYYKRLREKVKFVLLECGGGWESCFCCSMGANKTDDYQLAMRFSKEADKILVEVKDESLENLFNIGKTCEFTPEFVTENKTTVTIPDITPELVPEIYKLSMWDEYNSRCVGCGACNAVCITCSCFNTTDTTYTQNSKIGERRRTWTGCLNDKFTTVAGGHAFRDKIGDRMRFKALHKLYDYRQRFKTDGHMCVGCGRCDDVCPQYIAFSHTIKKLHDAAEQLKGGGLK